MNREPDAGRSASDGLLELHDVAGRVVVVPCVVELSAVAHQAMAAVVDPVDERFPRGHDALITSALHRGGNFYHGQVDDTHGLAVRHVLFADVEARAQHDLAFGDGAAVVRRRRSRCRAWHRQRCPCGATSLTNAGKRTI